MYKVSLTVISFFTCLAIATSADPVVDVPSGPAPNVSAALAIVDPDGEIRVENTHVDPAAVGLSGSSVTIRSYAPGFTAPSAGATVPFFTVSSSGTFVLDGINVDDSTPGGVGIGINTEATTLTLENCVVTNADNGVLVDGASAGTTLIVNSTDITSNTNSGLQVLGQSNITLSGTSVDPSEISANNGHGVFINAANTVVNASNTRFAGNNLSGFRVEVVNDVTATFTDCEFSGNQATGTNGGGLSISPVNGGASNGKATITVDSCRIINNSSGGEGGGIFVVDGADLTLTNSIIANNSANDFGAIRAWNGIHRIVNNTFDNNSSTVGVIGGCGMDGGFATGSPDHTSYFVNNIFTNHTGDVINGGINGENVDEALIVMLNNVLEASSGNGVNAATDVNDSPVTGDALFNETVDYTISASSAANGTGVDQATVDADINTSTSGIIIPADDFDGDVRPTALSIGAQEFEVPLSSLTRVSNNTWAIYE